MDDQHWILVTEFSSADEIVPLSGGWWRHPALDEEGLPVFCWPVFDSWDALIDVVAWELSEPDAWWRRTGKAEILTDNVWRHHDGPIRLVETPDAWLSGGRLGTCVLDWTIDLQDLFWGRTLAPSTPRLAQQVRRTLDAWPVVVVAAPR